MLNQGFQSRPCGIKGPPVWAQGPSAPHPHRSRAPFTFVKEINLPLLSAGRGQSGRKRDACCPPGGGGAICPQRQAAASESTSRPNPSANRKRQQRGSNLFPNVPRLDPDRPFACIFSPAQPQEDTKENFRGTGTEPQECGVAPSTCH